MKFTVEIPDDFVAEDGSAFDAVCSALEHFEIPAYIVEVKSPIGSREFLERFIELGNYFIEAYDIAFFEDSKAKELEDLVKSAQGFLNKVKESESEHATAGVNGNLLTAAEWFAKAWNERRSEEEQIEVHKSLIAAIEDAKKARR